MEAILFVIVLTTVLFVGLILLLATKPKYAAKITGTFFAVIAVGGLLLYGYGFAVTEESLPLAVVRALLAACGMFMGKNDLSAIADAPLMQHGWMHLIYWILHLLALYTTASAAITAVGAEALKKLRLLLARRGQMNLIYGINDDSLELGKQLMRQKNSVVVYVDTKPDAGQIAAIASAGCAVRNDSNALSASRKFLSSVGLNGGNRKITVYALHKDSSANTQYAYALLRSMKEQGIKPEQTRLVILGQEAHTTGKLQVTADSYGYGFVSAVHEAELAARLLVRSYPPCRSITFDENCAAGEDFEALIIGFGQTGQAVLKQLVMNGQFSGSAFHAAVFAPDCNRVDGFFSGQYESVLNHYDITFYDSDARSRRMCEYLNSHAQTLKYTVICTGSEKLNREIAEELCSCFRRLGVQVPVYQCSHSGVKAYGPDGIVVRQHKLYDPELLSMSELDRMAMILNHRYQNDPNSTAVEHWMRCDYFSRQSCRASADFISAMLHAAHKTQQQAMEDWQLSAVQLENLSRTEHLRWNAFHFCMGFSTMTDEEFDSRAREYRRQLSEDGKASIRITKNLPGRTHACLVSWEDLQALSAKEEKVTGKYTDYQYLDTQNVLAVPQLLRESAGGTDRT